MLPDERRAHWLRDLIIPIIVAIVVGISSAFVTVRVAVAVLETELISVKEDVVDLRLILQVAQDNREAKSRLQIIVDDNRAEVIELWNEINRIKAAGYTKEDAERDMQILRLEAKAKSSEKVK